MFLTANSQIEDYRAKGWWGTKTVDDMLQAAILAHPASIALVDPLNRESLDGVPPRSLSWTELGEEVEKTAAALLARGLQKDDRLVVQLPNTVDAVIIFLAAARIGLIISPVVMQYREHEISYIIEKIEPAAFVTIPQFGGFDHDKLGHNLTDELANVQLITLNDGGDTALDLLSADTATVRDYREKNPLDAAEILTICWTSGTESRPKGVPRNHCHWVLNAEVIVDAAGMIESDVLLNPFPLVNIGSIGGLVLPWLQLQTKLVLHHPFDIGIFLNQIADEKVSYTIAPPAVLGALLKNPELLERFDIGSLRAVGSGSAPLSPWLIESWKSIHDIEITNIFGSNEGSSLFSSPGFVPDPNERARFFPRLGAKGTDWPGRVAEVMQTRLVDPATGAEITETGQVGEMRLAGATIFSGYWRSPELNDAAFDEDGYFATGDLFEIAGDGALSRYYRFVGRSKEIIVRGGVNISPAELDDLIVGHPKIREAATVGIADEKLGERVAVAVAPNVGEDVSLSDLTTWLGEQHIAIFKHPEMLVTVDQLPRNAMNKVMRDELREIVIAKLG
ncbi:class I adenylate-forming enzyme family protein [Parasphingorhabdus sp.]|uniref:class I adenylate-forming enzyme family protein n=1 Tax=Parasphingorhabdus sp. TaxID=2709688 RepID=UPI002B26C494|nr:class I adenylate-forming enzyme family protein [Parasphingorhabdus sp.]|tara:strand:- start:4440 stop:6131 length:1692 start_codon:yes stop_codon:yes gene_type:complete